MTNRAPAPVIVRVSGRRDWLQGSHPEVWIGVNGTSIRLTPKDGMSLASGTAVPDDLIAEVELLWLTRAEQAVIEQAPIDGSAGLGAAIAALLLGIPPGDGAPETVLRRQLAMSVRGLLSAVASDRLATGAVQATPHQALVIRAMQSVNAQLHDPALTSAVIAGQLGVSLRTLQVAFRDSGAAPTAYIRALRLERARAEVAASSSPLSRVEAAALGSRWGFRGSAHFVRAYEREFGVRPGHSGP